MKSVTYLDWPVLDNGQKEIQKDTQGHVAIFTFLDSIYLFHINKPSKTNTLWQLHLWGIEVC